MRRPFQTLLAIAALIGAGSTVAAPTVVKNNQTTNQRSGTFPISRNGTISPISQSSGLGFRKRRAKMDLADMGQKRYRKHCWQNPTLYKSKKHRSKN